MILGLYYCGMAWQGNVSYDDTLLFTSAAPENEAGFCAVSLRIDC